MQFPLGEAHRTRAPPCVTGYPNPLAAAAVAARRQASAAVSQFAASLADAEVDLPDPVDGFRITPTGTVPAHRRPGADRP
jgi:hypothetical protein